jgi:hypothetical protein
LQIIHFVRGGRASCRARLQPLDERRGCQVVFSRLAVELIALATGTLQNDQ